MWQKFKWDMFVTSFIPLWLSIVVLDAWNIVSLALEKWDDKSKMLENLKNILCSSSVQVISVKLKAGIEKSGVPRITIHCFRHSHISYLVNKGWSAPVVASRVGHESIYITTHYMHAYSEMEDAMCEMMDKDMA